MSADLSSYLFQAAGEAGIVATQNAALAAGPRFASLEYIVNAAFIWAALMIICVLVFGYREFRKNDRDSTADAFQEELDAMRKAPRRSRPLRSGGARV